jgi:ethylbenzene hydroxylase subunit alpha/complex iron-sulfur molybdoenzyme family reductase subunit alpha
VASKRTCSFIGFTSAKQFHGDLMERSLLLAMALTGNWGKPGTGFNCFLVPEVGVGPLAGMEEPLTSWSLMRMGARGMARDTWNRLTDPDYSTEIASRDFMVEASKKAGTVPPVFYLYNHAGYDELWDRKDWNDPALERSFGEYLKESIERGYWDERQTQPGPDTIPQVLMLMAHNPLRRARSGRSRYVDHLFPKLKMVFALETRLSSSAAFADVVLPCAWYYEKADLTMTFGLNPYTCLIEQAAKPPGEARSEWEILADLARKISERAAARDIESFSDRAGEEQRYADLAERFTMRGRLTSNEDVVAEMIRVAAALGTFPKGTTWETMRETGQVRVAGIGAGHVAQAAAADVDPSRPFYSLAWHVDEKRVFPTYARRAQFYIDHEWFREAGEALPTHKETPPIGGEHPFRLVSGHVRGSIHSMHAATPFFMRLHRAQPVLFMNDRIAAERGIEDGEMVRLFNDVDGCELMVSRSAAVGPDQVVVYMWEPFQFKDWKPHDAMLVGMPKSLQLAGDYGQMVFHSVSGSPSPASDRGLRVDVAKVDTRGEART